MKTKFILSTLFIILLSSSLHAADDADFFFSQEYSGGVYVELGGRSNPEAIGAEIGFFGFTSPYTELRASFALLASEKSDDIFTGFNIGSRFQYGNTFIPFVGFGAFAGYSKESVSADTDDIDNDHDGSVDEDGEEKEIVDNVIGSVYPEAGIHIIPAKNTRITFSAKYHVTSEGRENDFAVYNIGFSLLFE